jgi:endoglucanase
VLKVANRLVYSPHAYASAEHVFQSYEKLRQIYDARAGYLLKSEPEVPLWVGELGTCQTLDCGQNSQWFRWFVQYLSENDLSWSYWPLNGTQSSGVGRKYDTVETYGLLTTDSQHIAAPKIVELLRTIEAPMQHNQKPLVH